VRLRLLLNRQKRAAENCGVARRAAGGDFRGRMLMKVLVVDDNALTRYTIKALLNRLGHEVVAEAESGAEAVDFFTKFKPDVVFLDLILPGRSGVEVLEDLRAVDPAANVVIITAVDQDELDRRLSDKGVKAILRKPFSYDDFKVLMKSLA